MDDFGDRLKKVERDLQGTNSAVHKTALNELRQMADDFDC
jgi:hypothetical protein